MSQHRLLNNIDHKDLKVRRERSADLGDAVMAAITFPTEFRDIQAHYPILFQRNAQTGAYQALALLGFEKGENLFLNSAGWDAHYIPMSIAVQPFLIGLQNRSGDDAQLMVHIDLDSPRVSESGGEPVFLPHGGNTPFLENIIATLDQLHAGASMSGDFFTSVDALGLIEPMSAEIQLADGSVNRLVGFHTVNEERLAALPADALASLHAGGHLQMLYMALASLSNLRDLIERKNAASRG